MKIQHPIAITLTLAVLSLSQAAWADNTKKTLSDTASGRQSADKTFDGRRDVLPVEVGHSTTTKRNPVGDKASDYKAPVRVSPATPPPSPVNRNNPTGDKDVQRGLDKYRQDHQSRNNNK